jgi:hypothetical protein
MLPEQNNKDNTASVSASDPVSDPASDHVSDPASDPASDHRHYHLRELMKYGDYLPTDENGPMFQFQPSRINTNLPVQSDMKTVNKFCNTVYVPQSVTNVEYLQELMKYGDYLPSNENGPMFQFQPSVNDKLI